MITKFEKYNEGINHLLVGPTKEEMWDYFVGDKLKGFIDSIPDSPEDFFNKMIDGCIEMSKDKHGTCFGKNGIKLFRHDSKYNTQLGVNWYYIWSVLDLFYGLKFNESQLLIKKLLKDTKWKNLTPFQRDNVDLI